MGNAQTKEKLKRVNKKTIAKKICFSVIVLLVTCLFVATGTLNTLLIKMQNECTSKPFTSIYPPKPFSKPYCQTFVMFIAMSSCLLIYYGKEIFDRGYLMRKNLFYFKTSKNTVDYVFDSETENEDLSANETINIYKKKKRKKELNELFYIFPSLCDVSGSALLCVALLFTTASVFQMLRSSLVVFVAILSIIILKKNIWRFVHKWIGVITITIGSFLVGFSSIYNNKDEKSLNPFLGAMLILISQFIYAIQALFEEVFLQKYESSPTKVAGYEGFWGLFLLAAVLLLFYLIPGDDNGSYENFSSFLQELVWNYKLGSFVLALLISICVFMMCYNFLTKYLSAASSVTIDGIRNVLIWVVQMCRKEEKFQWLQLVGFLLIIFGTFIFNEVGFGFCLPKYAKWIKKMNKKDKHKSWLSKTAFKNVGNYCKVRTY